MKQNLINIKMEDLQNLIKFLKDKGLEHQKINVDVLCGIIEYFANKQKTKQCNIADVSSSLDREMTIEEHLQNIVKHRKKAKMIYAINMLRDAESEDDWLNAVAIKEELNWQEVDDELKDQWNDYFGDAKKYLP